MKCHKGHGAPHSTRIELVVSTALWKGLGGGGVTVQLADGNQAVMQCHKGHSTRIELVVSTAGADPGFEKGGFNLVPKRDTGGATSTY